MKHPASGSCGAGLRVATASGAILRGDVAHCKEGFNPAIFIGYPREP